MEPYDNEIEFDLSFCEDPFSEEENSLKMRKSYKNTGFQEKTEENDRFYQ